MHSSRLLEEMPLQQPRPKTNGLAHYIFQQETAKEEHHKDLPCQLSNNPYIAHTNNRLTTITNHSFSKWAFTQISTHDHKQEESPRTIFQQYPFQDHQTISQATFKPNDLKQHLRQTKSLKKILQMTLGMDNRPKEKNKPKNTERANKGKTRYQKILEEVFSQKLQGEALKQKINQQFIPDFKERHLRGDSSRTRNNFSMPSSHREYVKTFKQNAQSKNSQRQRRSFQQHIQEGEPSEKRIEKTHSMANLIKTISQTATHYARESSTLKGQALISQKQGTMRSGWMKMTFGERQDRILQARRQKQNVGRQLSRQKQVRQCTFKPVTTTYHGSRPAETASSYAKLYYQRVRRRL